MLYRPRVTAEVGVGVRVYQVRSLTHSCSLSFSLSLSFLPSLSPSIFLSLSRQGRPWWRTILLPPLLSVDESRLFPPGKTVHVGILSTSAPRRPPPGPPLEDIPLSFSSLALDARTLRIRVSCPSDCSLSAFARFSSHSGITI